MDADRSASRVREDRLSGPAAPGPVAGADPAPDWLVLRREDLAAVVARYRREHRRPRQWIGLVAGVGALVVATLAITIGEGQGWPAPFGPFVLAAGWTVALGSFLLVARRERQLQARHQFACPACGAPLLGPSLGHGGVARAELAVATGNCPLCGKQILAP